MGNDFTAYAYIIIIIIAMIIIFSTSAAKRHLITTFQITTYIDDTNCRLIQD